MPSRSPTRSRSLARSIPLVLSAGLAVVICVYATVAYVDLRRVMVEHEESRLLGVSSLLARLSSNSVGQRVRELETLSERARIVRAVQVGDSAASAAALDLLLARARQGGASFLATEVRGPDGACIVSVWRSGEGAPLEAGPRCPLGLPAPELPQDSSDLSPLRTRGDLLYYSYAAPAASGRLVEHRLVTPGSATALIAGLIAPDAAVVIGNRDGSVGSEGIEALVPGMIAAPADPSVFPSGDQRRIGVGAHVPDTPLAVWVHRDLDAVLAPARQALVNRIILGIVVLLLGSLGSVLLSRRLTGPLRQITEAADDLRSGDWSRRVELDREDELGRLAYAFNSMAAALEASHAELERRVAHRTAELQEALDRLARAQEELVKRERLAVLGQLAGGVAHELRSPLGVMTNSVYYLRAVLTELPARSADYLDILDRQIEIAKKIISDLLDYARVRPADREPTALPSLITDVLATAPRNGRVDLRREIDPLAPLALIDSDQIRQVVLNVVTNAIQAVHEAADPTVTIRILPGGEDDVLVEVEDNGPGVPSEDRERVFEPLFSTKPTGIGLGLAVSRSLARANGGELEVGASSSGGALFRLHLPAAAAEAAPSALSGTTGAS